MNIPEDMLDKEAAKELNAAAVVSIRDLIILLSTDQQLADHQEKQQIIAREPWRKSGGHFRQVPGKNYGFITVPQFDWSGTRFENEPKLVIRKSKDGDHYEFTTE